MGSSCECKEIALSLHSETCESPNVEQSTGDGAQSQGETTCATSPELETDGITCNISTNFNTISFLCTRFAQLLC